MLGGHPERTRIADMLITHISNIYIALPYNDKGSVNGVKQSIKYLLWPQIERTKGKIKLKENKQTINKSEARMFSEFATT